MKKTPCPSLELYYEKPLVYEESVSAAKAFLLAYSDNDYPPADLPAAADAVSELCHTKVHRPYVSGAVQPDLSTTGQDLQPDKFHLQPVLP